MSLIAFCPSVPIVGRQMLWTTLYGGVAQHRKLVSQMKREMGGFRKRRRRPAVI